MKSRLMALSLLIFSPLLVAQLHYDEDADDLLSLYDEEDLITIATGTDKPIRFAPSVATVITAEDIADTGARFLDDVLEMVPGLHVAKGSNRLNSIYSVRGIHTAENPQVLLLIDGVDSAQLFTSNRPFNFRIPTANISRIEVIRGPGSAVYGADAFAGVINVITKTPSETGEAVIGGRAGSFNSQDAWFVAGKQLDNINIDFSLEYSRSDGDDDRIVPVDAGTTFLFGTGVGATLAPGELNTDYELFNTRIGVSTEDWKLSLHSWNLIDAGLGSGGAEALDPVGDDESDSITVNYQHRFNDLIEHWRFDLHVSGNQLDQNPSFILYPPGSTIPLPGFGFFADGVIGRPHSTEEKYAGEIISFYDGIDDHKIRFSTGYEYQDIDLTEVKNFDFGGAIVPGVLTDVTNTPLVFLQDQTRELFYLSLQDEWRVANDWELTLGIRYDEYNDFGSTVNPRIALIWAADYNFTVKALYGRAFRAPSFAELFAENNPALIGNPDLDPETIDTFEMAFDYQPNTNVSTKLNIFYYEIDDLINSVLGSPAQNGASQYGVGFEWELDWQVSEELSVDANFSWQDADQSGADVPDAPGYQAYLLAKWKPKRDWTASTVVNWVVSRDRAIADTRPDIDDYVSIDLIVRNLNIMDGLDLGFIATNLLNDDIREPSDGQIPNDYPLDSRSVRIELTYRLTGL